jgi:RND family efflux transporter MFP subunit
MEIAVSSNEIETPLERRPVRNLKMKAIVVLLIAAGVVVWGVSSRARDKSALTQVTLEQSVPTVKVVQPSPQQGVQALTLPGTLQAFYSATVYARVSGYLKDWSVDIGAPVKSGQVLATIETPELDQQLKQSEANLDTALANEKLTEITSRRWKNLLQSDSVSQQEADEKSGDYEAKKALVEAARADVERYRAMEAFKRITAPFDGVVTTRKTDIGALINAGHDAGHELFTVADVHKLRLYVNVPQNYAPQIHVGAKARLDVPERPGEVFTATLSDNSHAVSENSGTVLVELEVDNRKGDLLPGGFGSVHFDLAPSANIVEVPASALIFRKEGLMVATLTTDNKIAFRHIKISRDLGPVVEVASDLSTSDRIIDNPPDSLENGEAVRISDSNASNAHVATAGGEKS